MQGVVYSYFRMYLASSSSGTLVSICVGLTWNAESNQVDEGRYKTMKLLKNVRRKDVKKS